MCPAHLPWAPTFLISARTGGSVYTHQPNLPLPFSTAHSATKSPCCCANSPTHLRRSAHLHLQELRPPAPHASHLPVPTTSSRGSHEPSPHRLPHRPFQNSEMIISHPFLSPKWAPPTTPWGKNKTQPQTHGPDSLCRFPLPALCPPAHETHPDPPS